MNIVVLLFVAVSLLAPRVFMGQNQSDRRLSVHGLLGVFAPTGRHRSVIGDAFAIGAQVGLGLRPSVALVAGVLVSQTSYKSPLQGDVTVVQYDVGFEFAPSAPPSSAHSVRRRVTPFVGGGAGARSYNLREGSGATRVFPAGYVSGGVELAIGAAGLRIEARDYVSRSELTGALSGTRNDVTAVAGIAYHFR